MKTTIIGGIVVIIVGAFIVDPIKNAIIPSENNKIELSTKIANVNITKQKTIVGGYKNSNDRTQLNNEDHLFGSFSENHSNKKMITPFQKEISLDNSITPDFGKFNNKKKEQNNITAFDSITDK